MNTLNKFLISTLILAVMSFNLAEAAAPLGKAVTPSMVLQGGSTSIVKWAAPLSLTYKVHVFVPSTGNVTNALYRVYPKGKRAGSIACRTTDKLYPCYAVTIDQTQHRNAWVQLTQNGDPETQWAFTKTRGYVAAVADNLGQETLLNVSGQIRFENMSIAIGKTYQGGIIFYIDETGLHGLIAAPGDQGSALKWDNGDYIRVGNTSPDIGAGLANTVNIIAALGPGSYPAQITYDLSLNDYSDWFLPSEYEMDVMYRNIGPGAPAPLTNIGGFASEWYWTSHEDGSNNAHAWFFGNDQGLSIPIDKHYCCGAVRAVRAF